MTEIYALELQANTNTKLCALASFCWKWYKENGLSCLTTLTMFTYFRKTKDCCIAWKLLYLVLFFSEIKPKQGFLCFLLTVLYIQSLAWCFLHIISTSATARLRTEHWCVVCQQSPRHQPTGCSLCAAEGMGPHYKPQCDSRVGSGKDAEPRL